MVLLNEQIDGKYEILEKIREGGMGAIYKVRHRLLDEIRVVKVIRAQAEAAGEAADRFLQEARAAIKLRHPNVAVLHDFAVSGDGQAFIVLEYIDGWNLLEVLNGYGPPPVPLTLEIARQSLKALGYLHRHKIVHRDVSPDNLMLTRDVDGNPLVKLIDMGIAKALEGQGGLTTTGVFLGKPRYGSPERFSGGEWDQRSDLYSFGVVFYELLTGCSPVTGSEPAALMAGHLFRPPIPFEETDPGGRVLPELRTVVLRALAKKPEERMASAEDFLWELTLLQDRFPLTREEMEEVWRALPAAPVAKPASQPSGSIQDHLDLEFGMVKTPPAGTLSVEGLRTEPAAQPSPLGRVVPFSPLTRAVTAPISAGAEGEPTVRIASADDLDSTWASRPLRTRPETAAEVPEPAPEPAPSPSRVRGAVAVKPSRGRAGWITAAVAGLALVAAGAWLLARRPQPAVPAASPPSAQAALPAASSVVVAPGGPVAVEPTPVPSPPSAAPAAPPPPSAGSNPGLERKAVKVIAETTPAAPLEPMKLGDTIQRRQPGVELPEVHSLPGYSYPAAATGTGKKVTIRVAVLVAENGQVIDAQIREGDNSGLGFEEAALAAARKARFVPANRDGIAGRMWTELLFDFAE